MNTPSHVLTGILLACAMTFMASFSHALSLTDYGAAGNGSTNDTTAVNNAFSAAASSGEWLTGMNKTYAVNGNINVPAGLKLKDCTFKQLSPSNSSRKTLTASSTNGVHFRNVKVNRNGGGSSGSVDHANGMRFDSCNDLILEYCEVYGNDKGTGIVLDSCQRFEMNHPYVHDIRYNHTGETGPSAQGIWLINCSNGSIRQPVVSGLGRTATGELQDLNSRGICLSGSSNIVIDDALISRCDAGIMVGGSAGNSNVAINGGVISNVYSTGVSFVGTGTSCSVTGMIVEHAGLYGYSVFAPDSPLQNMPRDIIFSGCMARNIGSHGGWPAASPRGFVAQRESGSPPASGYPKNVRFDGCTAISDLGSSVFTVHDSDEFTLSSYLNLSRGTRVRLTTTSTLPSGLSTGTDYWLIPLPDTNRFKLASSYSNALNGTAITTSSGGLGTQTMTLQSNMYYGFFGNVIVSDSSAPVVATGCHVIGATSQSYAGIHSPIAITNRGSSQSIGNNTWTNALSNNNVLNSLNVVDTATPAPDYIAPFAGVWRMEVSLAFSASATGYRSARFMVDTGSGYTDTGTGVNVSGQTAAAPASLNASWEGALKKGDKVKVQVYQNSGGSLSLEIHRIVFRLALDTGT